MGEDLFSAVGSLVVTGIESIAMVIIACGSLWAVYALLNAEVHRNPTGVRRVRIQLGNTITLALEFLIGADILRASLTPTWEALGQVAVIIFLRALLTYLIDWELKSIRAEEAQSTTPSAQ